MPLSLDKYILIRWQKPQISAPNFCYSCRSISSTSSSQMAPEKAQHVSIFINDFKLLSPTHSPYLFGQLSKSDESDIEKPESTPSTRPKSTPWTSRPQPLQRSLRNWWWWDFGIDLAVIVVPIPFLLLGATVIAFNGKAVDEGDLNILDQAIRGVSRIFPPKTLTKSLNRQQLLSLSFSLQSLGGLRSNTQLGN